MDKMEYLLKLFKGTRRQGPGSDAATMKALSMIELPEQPDILDIGCGSGTQTIDVMLSTGCRMTAVDIFDEFLDELKENAAGRGLADKLKTVKADMNALPFNDESFDCIWSEGSVYIMGFENGIRAWRRFLKPEGFLIVSDAAFISQSPPKEIIDYWREVYPDMTYLEENTAKAEKAGYEVTGTFVLDTSAWYEYYGDVALRLNVFKKKYSDETALGIIKETEKEMEMRLNYGEYYSYVFYILKKN